MAEIFKIYVNYKPNHGSEIHHIYKSCSNLSKEEYTECVTRCRNLGGHLRIVPTTWNYKEVSMNTKENRKRKKGTKCRDKYEANSRR